MSDLAGQKRTLGRRFGMSATCQQLKTWPRGRYSPLRPDYVYRMPLPQSQRTTSIFSGVDPRPIRWPGVGLPHLALAPPQGPKDRSLPSQSRIQTVQARKSPSIRMVSRKGKTFDQLFVRHHPIVGRWKQAIDTFQPEWSPESDDLGARPYCHRKQPPANGNKNRLR
jgi:hypothetical protein